MWPEWLDPDLARWLAVGALVLIVLVALWILRFIQKMVLRVVLLGVAAVLGLVLYLQQDALAECGPPECSCQLFGFDVQIDACQRIPTRG